MKVSELINILYKVNGNAEVRFGTNAAPEKEVTLVLETTSYNENASYDKKKVGAILPEYIVYLNRIDLLTK
jgi:hypothetical protein